MSRSTTNERSEKKYLPGGSRYHLTLETVKKFVPVYMFRKNQPVTHVRTTYFDNETFDTYYDWLNREPIRYKVRYREYGYDGKFSDEVWMELKVRNYSISQKKRFKIKRADIEKFISGQDVLKDVVKGNRKNRDIIDTYASIQGYIVSNHLKPILTVEYKRISFQPSEESDVRITLDRDITMRNVLTGKAAEDDRVVLETKVSGPHTPLWLNDMIEEVGTTRNVRFSKFALGMHLLFFQEQPCLPPGEPREVSAPGKVSAGPA
jgi:SPX domain protein involved in polyphosphate accumulation